MDNTPFLLDNSLAFGIAEWFRTNIYFAGLFKVINSYNRIDVPQPELNSVNVYLLPTNVRQMPCKVIGKVKIDVNFDLKQQNENKFKQIYQTLNAIRAQLLSNPNYIQQYLSINWVPGLQSIQLINEINYSTVTQSLLKTAAVVTVPITLDYQIDILLNQRALWAAGNDFYSTNEVIYNQIEEIYIDTTAKKYRKIKL